MGTSRIALILFVLLLCGCGSPISFAPVEGTITRNGQRVAGVQVIFLADGDSRGPQVSGITDKQGRYRLYKDDRQDGAPIGQHRVCLIDIGESPMSPKPPFERKKEKLPRVLKKPAPSRVPTEYGSPGSTPLRAEVRPGLQTIDFQLP